MGCGGRLSGVTATAGLQPAGLGRRIVATVVDLIVIVLLSEAMNAFLAHLVVALIGSGILYYGLFQARGQQTLGQYVLRLTTLTDERLPLKLLQSCTRAMLGALSWALVVPPLLALREPTHRTPVDRMLKVQVFRTP